MSFVHLPPEIWLRISESLPRSDAARLCLANHQFLSLIRPLIYHHVSLYQVDRIYESNQADLCDATPKPIDATLSLLARDSDLAQRVSGLSLHAPSSPYNLAIKSLINLDAMRNMISLRRLELSGPIFHLGDVWVDDPKVREASETSVAFCEILQGIGLEELVVHHSPGSVIGFSLEQFAELRGLKKVGWVGWRGHIGKFLSLDKLREMPTSRLGCEQDLVSQKPYAHYCLLPAQHWKHSIFVQAATLLQSNQPYSPSTSLV
ncbi:hypothetical protein PQX77_007074 [Marasmius sp. AFHP31]|nr:hypothetical protein PQX77_007074 [Marasmius sp. AFHP31]